MSGTDTYSKLLRIGEVAEAFGVTVPTVRAWDKAGKLTSVRTPGGQRKFPAAEVQALLAAVQS